MAEGSRQKVAALPDQPAVWNDAKLVPILHGNNVAMTQTNLCIHFTFYQE